MTPPCNWAVTQNCTGAYGMRPYGRILCLQQTINFVVIARHPGGVKPPPYNTIGKWDRRGEQCSPVEFYGYARFHGRSMIAPTAHVWSAVGGGVLDAPFWPRRGQYEEGPKSVKKNAALLHFLAFGAFDLLFGVLRGEQPLSRASRAIGSSGHLFRFLFGCPKRKAIG